ncbi:restriction endonuclease subunit S [Ligilactobacillus salivarius]|uniref:restriction endonuclease subunit S n=1 Tax=Ligilactobacillus salivarius TaxID=1624 RepID=UPI00339C52C6
MFPTQFTGASFTWERKKLGDVAEKVIQKNNNNAFKNVLTNSAEHGIISQRDFFERNIANKNNISTYYIVQNDDFVYNPRISNSAPYGPINRNKTGYTGIISPLYYVFRVLGINTAFIEWYFKTTCWHKFMYQHGDSGARSDRFSIKDNELKKLPIKLPADDTEQEKIAKTLNSLNNTIQLHEQKCEELTLIKQALLQKLFPKKDEVRPDVRYKNFSDAWEQRKLVSLFSKFTDGDWIESKDQANTGIRLIQTGNIGITEFINKFGNEKWISEETFKKLNCEEIFPGDIIISRLPDPAGRACILPKLDTRMITAVDCTIARTSRETSAEFIVQYLSTQTYFKYVQSCLAGGTRQRISRKNLANFNVSIPTEINEQKQIGFFFKQLDTLIALHQRKLEKLKQLKKFLLQNMFI